MTTSRLASLFVLLLVLSVSTLAFAQRGRNGLFTLTESGEEIELTAWALQQRLGPFKMDTGTLKDAPTLPRTYRAVVNLGSYEIAGVLAVNSDVFSKPLSELHTKLLPFSKVPLAVKTFEVGVPELEDWDKVLALRRSLKATKEKPLVFFYVLTNVATMRYYPFFIDR